MYTCDLPHSWSYYKISGGGVFVLRKLLSVFGSRRSVYQAMDEVGVTALY